MNSDNVPDIATTADKAGMSYAALEIISVRQSALSQFAVDIAPEDDGKEEDDARLLCVKLRLFRGRRRANLR